MSSVPPSHITPSPYCLTLYYHPLTPPSHPITHSPLHPITILSRLPHYPLTPSPLSHHLLSSPSPRRDADKTQYHQSNPLISPHHPITSPYHPTLYYHPFPITLSPITTLPYYHLLCHLARGAMQTRLNVISPTLSYHPTTLLPHPLLSPTHYHPLPLTPPSIITSLPSPHHPLTPLPYYHLLCHHSSRRDADETQCHQSHPLEN